MWAASLAPLLLLARLMIWGDTNNLLTLFTKLYSDAEVLRKVVVVKADRYSWYA
jgi:para-aminobenzoate synthetase